MGVRTYPVVLLLIACGCIATGCSSGGGGGHTTTFQPHALACRLQTTGKRGASAVVTYLDKTRNPKMSAAISAEVAAWNAAVGPIALIESKTTPAITFTAVTTTTTELPKCAGSAPRVVTVPLSVPRWNAAAGTKGAILDPPGAIARLLAHVLGLATGGRCPRITSNFACPHRRQVPGPLEQRILARLYSVAAPSATPRAAG